MRIQLSLDALERARRCPACLKNQQPETVFGSPEVLVENGVEAGARITAAFAEQLGKAVVGKASAKAIRSALSRQRIERERLEEVLLRSLLMGLMLGALDADFEMEEEAVIAPAQFAERDRKFTRHPLREALRVFEEREVVTPDVFAKMRAAAKKRAFTVAGMAERSMIQTAKDMLTRQIRDGASLVDFRGKVLQRLQGAGWTPKNASHVETIFRTNVLGAYSGGRHRQMTQPAVLALRPYWQVLTVNDGPPRQRPNHQATHLKVFRADDPVFPDAFTPWDYNCRCRFRTLSERQRGDQQIQRGSFLSGLGLPAPGFGGLSGKLTGGRVRRRR